MRIKIFLISLSLTHTHTHKLLKALETEEKQIRASICTTGLPKKIKQTKKSDFKATSQENVPEIEKYLNQYNKGSQIPRKLTKNNQL